MIYRDEQAVIKDIVELEAIFQRLKDAGYAASFAGSTTQNYIEVVDMTRDDWVMLDAVSFEVPVPKESDVFNRIRNRGYFPEDPR